MIEIIPSESRGKVDAGWLKSYHSFSFGDYHNPQMMGFETLRVINEDWIANSKGFPTHPHRDMEIFTYVVSGSLSHKDSMGNVKTVYAGEVQAMSAGTGVTHSEFNPSDKEKTHLLQIWVLPRERGLTPSYQEWKPKKADSFDLIVSPDGKEGSVQINQDVEVWAGFLLSSQKKSFTLAKGTAWLQVIDGSVTVEAGNTLQTVNAGDALALTQEENVAFGAEDRAQVMFFNFL